MYNVKYILTVINLAKPVWSRGLPAVVALELYTVTPVRQLGVHTPLSRTKLSFYYSGSFSLCIWTHHLDPLS